MRNYTMVQEEADSRRLLVKVYGWMFLGLIITGLVSLVVANSPDLLKIFIGNRIVFFGLFIGELALVSFLIGRIKKLSPSTAGLFFFLYAVLNGIVLSTVFLLYTGESVAITFFATASVFGVMSAYGYFTDKDLTTMGSLCIMALVGLIIASVINIFFSSGFLNWLITYGGIFIFIGLIAYDTQKIKNMQYIDEDEGALTKLSIIAALSLYLDFINLFLKLLRILGKKK